MGTIYDDDDVKPTHTILAYNYLHNLRNTDGRWNIMHPIIWFDCLTARHVKEGEWLMFCLADDEGKLAQHKENSERETQITQNETWRTAIRHATTSLSMKQSSEVCTSRGEIETTTRFQWCYLSVQSKEVITHDWETVAWLIDWLIYWLARSVI